MRTKEPPISKAQRALWSGLNDFARELGGWIESRPDVFPLRFECQPGSTLAEALRDFGHKVRHLGSHERLLPSTVTETRGRRTIVNQNIVPGTVEVYELSLVKQSDAAGPV
jgi:hypothetical protein